MNTTNRKNFKAFQTPSGIADPVRPNRAPQPYPGASPVKPNAETSDETLGEMADKMTDEMTVTGKSGRVPANMPGKTPGEIPGKMPGKMPVSEPDFASSDSDFKQNPPEKLSKEYANDSANPEPPLDATSKATPTPSQNNLHAGFDKTSENKNEENGKDYKVENQGKPDKEYAEGYDDVYHDDYDDEDTEDTYEDEYDDGDEDEEYMENDIRSWFYTFMCMNIPIYGWIYLRRLATGKIPTSLEQQDFAEAYLYYKKFFLKISAVILIVLIIIGAIAINKLLAYMQML